jgi:hypothetical protein
MMGLTEIQLRNDVRAASEVQSLDALAVSLGQLQQRFATAVMSCNEALALQREAKIRLDVATEVFLEKAGQVAGGTLGFV